MNLRSLKAGDHIRFGCGQRPANIRRVYSPGEETLGVLVIEIEHLRPATA
ncbi:hypothetical protein [Microbispora bryophytorum]